MLTFNRIVKKLLKQSWKVLMKTDIFELIDPEKKDKYKSFIDKIIYRLKIEWVIISLKAWIYIIPSEDDLKLNKIDLIDKYYFKLLKKYIIYYVWNNYYISWKKSLEIWLKNFEVPENIYIVNRNINKKIKFWWYEIIFKTISWNINYKKTNIFSRLSEYSVNKNIEWLDFKISNLELALVESAIINNSEDWVSLDILNKSIKKYSKVFNKTIFYEIWKLKFIMSFNRLKEISKHIDKDLSLIFLDIIKKNWWLFIGEWLRNIWKTI